MRNVFSKYNYIVGECITYLNKSNHSHLEIFLLININIISYDTTLHIIGFKKKLFNNCACIIRKYFAQLVIKRIVKIVKKES